MSRAVVYTPVESFDDTSFVSSNAPTDTTAATSWQEDERQPLLRSGFSRPSSSYSGHDENVTIQELQPTASSFSCAVNLANTILGTGMLAMPSAMASVGLFPGIVVILLSAMASGMGLYFLSCCARKTQGRQASFFAISQLTWPKMAVVFDLAIAIKCFGVAVSYLIIMGDLMPQVILSFFKNADQSALLMDRRFWITLLMATAVLPLSFLRKLDSLKYTSVVALIAVVYLCAIVVHYYFGPDFVPPPPDSVHYVTFSTKFFSYLPVFVFAFTCHQNIFSVYNELEDNNQHVINKTIGISIGSSMMIYQLIAILGYLSFGQDVKGNVISEYHQSLFVAGGRLAIVILVVFSYPLQAHPCRASLDKVLTWKQSEVASPWKYFAMTTSILVLSYLVAITVSQLDLVLAFVGSTGSTTISFILPGLFYYKLHETAPWKGKKLAAVVLAIYGCLVMVICLSFNISRLLH